MKSVSTSQRTCTTEELQNSRLVKKICVAQNSILKVQKNDGGTCLATDDQLPFRAEKSKSLTNCNRTAVVDQHLLENAVDAHFDASIKKCPKAAVYHVRKKEALYCWYRDSQNMALLVWYPRQRKACHVAVMFTRERDMCDADIKRVVQNVLALAKIKVNTRSVRTCSPKELAYTEYRLMTFSPNCFFRGVYYQWWKKNKIVCMIPFNAVKFIRDDWHYCEKETIAAMFTESEDSSGMKERKRRMDASMALISLSQQPKKSRSLYENLETEIQAWIRGGFTSYNVTTENIHFADQPETSRDVRATENTSVLTLRKLRQTSDSILVRFTVVVDSRQVKGIDFAADLERNMKENAYKFGGQGSNFKIDPNSIQVQEVYDDINAVTPSEISKKKYTIIAVILVGTLLLASFIAVFLLWSRKPKTIRQKFKVTR